MDTLSVTQLTRRIRTLLENEVGTVVVEGEISNHRLQSSGHQYFTLKDESAQISCVLFRGAGARLSTPLRDGMQVQVVGEVTVYEQRGNYQILVQTVQPKGLGSLQARFEALKQRLADEGLFDPEWKKPIPKIPRVVALVTSPTGAAIRDMLNIMGRRAPWLRVLVYPVRVQGQGAEQEIARAIGLLNRAEPLGLPEPDVIVVGRGGGSLEDLWNFNEEVVARAIFASRIPIISAVGHEIDFTISDFVADLRAPTPSAAAELLAPDRDELLKRLEGIARIIRHRTEATLSQHGRVLELLGKGTLMREPQRWLREAEQSVDDQADRLRQTIDQAWRRLGDRLQGHALTLERHRPQGVLAGADQRVRYLLQRLEMGMERALSLRAHKLESLQKLLQSMGPQSVLARGFSITTNAAGQVITKLDQVSAGQEILTQLADGKVASVVKEKRAKGSEG